VPPNAPVSRQTGDSIPQFPARGKGHARISGQALRLAGANFIGAAGTRFAKEKATLLAERGPFADETGARLLGKPPLSAASGDYWNSFRINWLLWLAIDSD
jgi:hypothetical protein